VDVNARMGPCRGGMCGRGGIQRVCLSLPPLATVGLMPRRRPARRDCEHAAMPALPALPVLPALPHAASPAPVWGRDCVARCGPVSAGRLMLVGLASEAKCPAAARAVAHVVHAGRHADNPGIRRQIQGARGAHAASTCSHDPRAYHHPRCAQPGRTGGIKPETDTDTDPDTDSRS